MIVYILKLMNLRTNGFDRLIQLCVVQILEIDQVNGYIKYLQIKFYIK